MLINLLCCLCVFVGGVMSSNKFDNIAQYFSLSVQIAVYENGEKVVYEKGSKEYFEILYAVNEMTTDAHELPAFGVSLDNETREAIEQGVWLEFVFAETQCHNEMPFDSLLFEVKSEDSGFNLIRQYNGKYDGRCFYLNLQGNMQLVEDLFLS